MLEKTEEWTIHRHVQHLVQDTEQRQTSKNTIQHRKLTW